MSNGMNETQSLRFEFHSWVFFETCLRLVPVCWLVFELKKEEVLVYPDLRYT